jgi:hypothetical protein
MKMVLVMVPVLALVLPLAAVEPCRLEVVEKESGWPVPLVELRTTHGVRFVTDNVGVIAFDMPELMGHEVWFDVIGHGYERDKDGFGYRGVRLTPEPGKTLKIEVKRAIIAKRLGRLTGGGLFGESQKVGRELDWRESGIVGCDSVLNAVYRGKMFWIWGDTTLAKYPLGIFNCSGATTPVQPFKSFEPPLRPAFNYFCNAAHQPRGVAAITGKGPKWLTGCVTLPDKHGQPHLVASCSKIENFLDVYEWGLCAWNDATSNFEVLRTIWKKSDAAKPPPMPEGHAALWKDAQGKEWVLFGNPLPKLRCPATFEAWQDSATWEVLKPQEKLEVVGGGKPVTPHTGSIAWNAFRRRWVTVFMEKFGKPSAFGELWYAEADAPTGPWGPALKILTHANYTFYNPRLHPEFTPPESPVLLFEGTYTAEFADHAAPTPRHNYNQILYRLDLDEPALAPAQKKCRGASVEGRGARGECRGASVEGRGARASASSSRGASTSEAHGDEPQNIE